MSLKVALEQPEAFAGIISFSGFFPSMFIEPSRYSIKTPVFALHGTEHEKMPWAHAWESYDEINMGDKL